MEVTRHNYEEYFLLYVDNELNAMERKAVEVFVQENPDLEEELVMLQQSVIRADEKLVFAPKEYLLKDTSKQGLVNEGNYEEYFVLYGDDELTNEQKALVEQFVYKFPRYQAEFELIQQARLVPEAMIFPDKQDLYRSEKDDNRVVPFAWWRMIAAAVVIFAVGLFLLNKEKQVTPDVVIIPKTEKKSEPISNIVTTPRVEQVVQSTKKEMPTAVKTIQQPKDQIVHLAVQPVEVTDNNLKPVDVISEPAISAPATINTLAIATPDETTTTPTVIKTAEIEEIIETTPAASTHYILNAPINKTPLRGLFRKISRVVDKATTVERDENGKGGLRVAAFEIAIK